jgi:glycerol-3-phosphate dehydrogenase
MSDAPGNSFDLLIVGGGINGVGIARDAVGRGLSVALVEQSDLASATSSASTKLIHGGLRYLELFEFRLVREALIERERLLAIAPHIIRPMDFILPHAEGLRPRWQIRLGLFFYDHIAGRRRLPASRAIDFAHAGHTTYLQDHIRHGFVYSDCCVDDSRLVVLNALDAAERGAAIRTRTRLHSARALNGAWQVQCEDQRTHARIELRARAIVNAAGPWVADVLQTCGVRNESQVRLVKGSHIVVPRMYAGEQAFLLQNPDGRVVFTIPYEQRYTLIGTTDLPFEADPATVSISAAEAAYLCDTVNGYFRRPIAPQDVVWSYAGVRPLSDDEAAHASKVTRDYKLELTSQPAPLLTIFGGKITTYRKLAQAALEKLQSVVGGSSTKWTSRSALPGGDLPRHDFAQFAQGVRKRWPFLPEPLAQRLARSYGTRIEKLLGAAKSTADLGAQLGAGLSEAEVDYLRNCEWAVSAQDILWRRTKLGLHMTQAERDAVTRHLGELPDEQRCASNKG